MSQLYTLDDNEYETGINNMILASKESHYQIKKITSSGLKPGGDVNSMDVIKSYIKIH
jgi:hypothetical protein